jgi:hypothetical protein
MSGDEGGSFLPPPEFPPPSDRGAVTPPPSIISEPKRSFLRRRIAGVPVWAWIIIDLLIVLVVIAVVTNGDDDGDQVETVEATTESAPSSERASTATSEASDASDAPTAAPQTTVPTTTEAPTTIAAATTAAPTTPTVAATTIPPPPSTSPPTTPPLPGFAEGIHLVGSEIQPGRYIATGFEFCYWERLSGLSGEDDDIVANDIPGERAIVAVLESDVAFNSYDCGQWTIYLPTVMVASFGSGDWVVGQDIAPGRYAANGAGGNCYWERASGFTHSVDEVITNDLQSGRAIVEIESSDVRFTSRDCGTWTPL